MAELGLDPRPPDSEDSPVPADRGARIHSVEAELACMTCLSSSSPELVPGVCVFSGAMHREGSARMSLIQMPGVMATVPLLSSSSPLGSL